MWQNYLKVAWRNLVRQKGYSLINIAGLTVGLTCSFLIMLWVKHELSFDRFHVNADRIYRVLMADHQPEGTEIHPWLPFPVGRALREQVPEIVAASRTAQDDFMVGYQDRIHSETTFLFVDPSFFSLFSLPFSRGLPERALADPASIVISEPMAVKYFGTDNPLGKTLTLNTKVDFTVSGVVRIPENSDFQYDFFLSFQAYPMFNADLAALEANWRGNNYPTFIQLAAGASPAAAEKKIVHFLKRHTPDRNTTLHLQRLDRLHLYNPDGSDGQMKNVRIFSLIAAFILIIACINFMNLATARFDRRSKEVALRKTVGASRSQICLQFFGESLLSAVIAFLGAIVLLKVLLPWFNELSQSSLRLELLDLGLMSWLAGITLLVGIFAGSYPAVFLSRFAPMTVIHRTLQKPKGQPLRKGLVIFQFALSTLLVICTHVVATQVNFIQRKNMGMDRSNLIFVRLNGESRNRAELVKQELLRNPAIVSATACRYLPSQIFVQWDGLEWQGKPAGKELPVAFASGDCDYIPTFGMTLAAGRNFSRDMAADESNVIVNEEAVRRMGLENPVGTAVDFWRQKGTIIGVVKDFHHRPLTDPIRPMLMTMREVGGRRSLLAVRIKPGHFSQAVEHFQRVWQRINPGFGFDYHFFDEAFEQLYLQDRQLGRIFFAFTLIAIFICSLGLAGLSAFMAVDKTKEIGIRKTLGASVREILFLFSRQFAGWILAANAIAWPVGYFLMHQWLRGYAYRSAIPLQTFVLAGGSGLLIALLTVSYQTLRAARANPVDSLRYE